MSILIKIFYASIPHLPQAEAPTLLRASKHAQQEERGELLVVTAALNLVRASRPARGRAPQHEGNRTIE